MASNQLYALLYVTVDGALLFEEGSVKVTRSSGSNPIMTVAKGYAGESPGASMTEIDVTNALPADDFEFDAGDKILFLKEVEMGVLGPGGKRGITRGFIIEDSLAHSTGGAASYDFKFRGPAIRFQ